MKVHHGRAEEGGGIWHHRGRRVRDQAGHQQVQVGVHSRSLYWTI